VSASGERNVRSITRYCAGSARLSGWVAIAIVAMHCCGSRRAVALITWPVRKTGLLLTVTVLDGSGWR